MPSTISQLAVLCALLLQVAAQTLSMYDDCFLKDFLELTLPVSSSSVGAIGTGCAPGSVRAQVNRAFILLFPAKWLA